jgi:protein-tyrosine phosphatase
MFPLVDVHCHLLAGLDDGPRTDEEAMAMCHMACEDGVCLAAATAHQNEEWSAVSPDRIRAAAQRLADMLRNAGIPLTVFPCAEVMVHPGIESAWRRGELLSVADRKQYLLVEMPHNIFVDLQDTVQRLKRAGIRPILAHPERHPELLHEYGQIEQLIQAGCLVQVSASSVTHPRSGPDSRALKSWFKRGVVHLLGSDGHSPSRRPPLMAGAYLQISRWVGSSVADRVCGANGMAILQGLPLRVGPPAPRGVRWLSRFW